MNILQYVTSGLTLIALIALVVLAAIKYLIDKNKRLIVTAKAEDRSKLVDRVLSDDFIDLSSITKERKYEIAKLQIKHRAQRYALGMKAIMILSLFFFALTAYTISFQNNRTFSNVSLTGKILNTKHQPIHGVKITIEGHDFLQETRSTGIFQGRLDNKISKGSYLIVNMLHKAYLPESLSIQVNGSTIQLHTIVLRKP